MISLRPAAILVVDDDPDHAQIARLVLRSIAPAIPVEVCRDTRTMRAVLGDLPGGTLVLLDRVIEGAESFGAIVDIRAQRPDVAIVMLSAALSSVDRAYAIACGAVEAIEKPSSLSGWRAALGALLGRLGAAPSRMALAPPDGGAPRAA